MVDRLKVDIFLLLIMIFPMIDVLNGVFLFYGYNLPIGTVYRLLFIAYILLEVSIRGIRSTKLYQLLLLSTFSLVAVCIVQTLFFNTGISVLVKESSYIIRFCLCLLIPFFAEQFQEQVSLDKVIKLTVVLDMLLITGLVVPYLFNLGSSTYDNTAGFKGFYFATNDIAYAFLIMLFLMGWYLIQRKQFAVPAYLSIILYFFNMYCLLILGTKSGLVVGALYSIYLLCYFLFAYKSPFLFEQFLVFEFILAGIVLMVLKGKDLLLQALSGVIRRFSYFRILYQDDWPRLLLSSRNIYLQDAVDKFLQTANNQVIFFFGSGFENRWTWYGRKGGLIEMDFFDMFFSYGIIGTFVLLVVMGYFLNTAAQQDNRRFCLFLLIFTIVYSFIVGHVFFSALSATVFGVVCLFIQENKEQIWQK
ncbi:O-antigen ligase family protein [Enterococcus sp. AZ109]|uniref:O-antigen ligase family protein n=1 Tax=Enterococcus sp. AZ109 TaxID=2774634 RepID=UPI003F203DC5